MTEHVLITGNMGYVGPAVVWELRKNVPERLLTGLDTAYFAHCLTGAWQLPECQLDQQLFTDIRDCDASLTGGVDAVVNLAAISNDPMGKSYADQTMEINHAAAINLARQAKLNGASRFVFASSCSVYGFAEGHARTEQDSVNPLTAYAKSKIQTEIDLATLADDSFTITCLRFPTACGMSPRLRLDLVLNDFVAGAVTGGKIDILSDGTPWRPLIDTKDMARAIEWALVRSATQGGHFLAVNVGLNQCNYQVRDLAEAVAAEVPGVEININQDAAPDKRSYQVDFGLYNQLAPEHLPRYSLKDSVRALADGIENMALTDHNFRESSYIRLRVLNDHRRTEVLNSDLRWAMLGSTSGL